MLRDSNEQKEPPRGIDIIAQRLLQVSVLADLSTGLAVMPTLLSVVQGISLAIVFKST